MSLILDARGLSYRYPDGQSALNAINLTLRPREKVALVGANGSGKSTLLLSLIGCLTPQNGSVHAFGRAVDGGFLPEMRRRTGFLFQNPEDQLFMPTVWEDVSIAPMSRGWERPRALEWARECMVMVGIAHLAQRPPWRLSNGERRLAAMAGILAMQPELFFMDEPTSDLDPRARRDFIALLNRLDQPILIATHDLDMAMECCARVVILSEGSVVGESPIPGLLGDEPFLRRHGLELPLSLQSLKN